ncbi:MAG: FkbM family methyltransferase [Nitrospira sp. CR1.1]|nr:FkbM family methyltransferase [Nitrospira sp. CR1.1]
MSFPARRMSSVRDFQPSESVDSPMVSFDHALELLLDAEDLVIADVGAAYGLPWYLQVLDEWATLCLFEPNAARAEELRKAYKKSNRRKKAHVFETALSASGGERVLYETNVPTGSSLLKPGSDALNEFGDPSYFFPIHAHRIQTRRLDDVLNEAGIQQVDFLKLDVQGAEIEVLHGLGERLRQSTLGVELEVGLPGGYLEQPSMGEVDEFLRSRGFTLFDLRPVRLHRPVHGDRTYYPRQVFGVHESSTSLSKRIWEVDALYFRGAEHLLKAGDRSGLRKLVVLYCAYGFFAEAHYLLTRVMEDHILPSPEAEGLRNAVMAWHRHRHYSMKESPRGWTIREFVSSWRNRLSRLFYRPRSSTWLVNE